MSSNGDVFSSSAPPQILSATCSDLVLSGPRGCPGPRGPEGPAGSQPPLSDAVDSPARDVAANSLAVKSVFDRTRAPATAHLTLYVRADGADSNSGLTAASAKASIQGALQATDRYDLQRFALTVNVGEGSFAVPPAMSGPQFLSSAGRLAITGQGKDRTTLIGRLSAYAVPRLYLRDLTVEGSEDGVVYLLDHTSLYVYGVRLRGRGGTGLCASRGACAWFFDGDSEIEGLFSYVLVANDTAHISVGTRTVTLSGPVECTAFIYAYRQGTIDMRGKFINSHLVAGGAKWSLTTGGQLIYSGNDPTASIPGATNGRATGANLLTGDASLARAWARTTATGAPVRAHNVLSCQKTGPGTYVYTCNQSVNVDAAALVTPVPDGRTGLQGGLTAVNGAQCTVCTSADGLPADCAHSLALLW